VGSNKKRQQTINKRNRERAIEEKRTLKRERKQAQREAARNGEPMPFETRTDEAVADTGEPMPLETPADQAAASVGDGET
jgi:hypothetical protein